MYLFVKMASIERYNQNYRYTRVSDIHVHVRSNVPNSLESVNRFNLTCNRSFNVTTVHVINDGGLYNCLCMWLQLFYKKQPCLSVFIVW